MNQDLLDQVLGFVTYAGTGVAGICVTAAGFMLKHNVDSHDSDKATIHAQGKALAALQSTVDHVVADQRAHAAHEEKLADVRVHVARIDERSAQTAKVAATALRGVQAVHAQNSKILAKLDAMDIFAPAPAADAAKPAPPARN